MILNILAEDATPLSGCEQLEVLDLEGNAIVDEEDIRHLASIRGYKTGAPRSSSGSSQSSWQSSREIQELWAAARTCDTRRDSVPARSAQPLGSDQILKEELGSPFETTEES